MWLNLRRSMACVLPAIGLSMLLGTNAFAAPADITLVVNGAEVNIVGTLGGPNASGPDGTETGSGTITEEYTISLDPDNSDSFVTSFVVRTTQGTIDSWDIVYGGSDTSVLGGTRSSGDEVSFAYLSSTYDNLRLRVTGSDGSGYFVSMSAVPLPAAAWMFLSMLFGGAWLKRRGSKRAGALAAA